MTKSKSSSLLDDLRRQSEELRAQNTAARQPIEAAIKEIDTNLWRAFRWLDEALGHLEVIHPAVAHRFALDKILVLDRPRFDRGFVSFRRGSFAGFEVLTYLEMFYRLSGPETLIVRVNPGAAGGVEARLRAATMQFNYQTEQDDKRVVRYGLFQIQPAIAASVRFAPDYARQIIDVTLNNVDRFETILLEFAPGRLDEAALEDLVKFMLGEENGFLRRAPLALIRPRGGEPDDKKDGGKTPTASGAERS